MKTSDRIVSFLQRESLTVAELASRLGMTRNAVIVPLRQLEASGLVTSRIRKEQRVGKPSWEYWVNPGREDETSLAYPAFAALLVEALADNLDEAGIQRLLHQVGERMAAELAVDPGLDDQARLQCATDFADDLGADTVVDHRETESWVRSFSCPLARAVRREPKVCSVMAAFFANAVGTRVEEHCQRGDKLICQFLIAYLRGETKPS